MQNDIDPYTPGDPLYECVDCGSRFSREGSVGLCEDCGGTLRNITVPRE